MCKNEQKPELEPIPCYEKIEVQSRSRSYVHENQELRSRSRSNVQEKEKLRSRSSFIFATAPQPC